MDALSTKQRPRNMFAAMLQSHRIRGLLFLVITLFGMYFFLLNTAQPHASVPYMDDVNVNELQQGRSRSYIFVAGREGDRTMYLLSMGIHKLKLYFAGISFITDDVDLALSPLEARIQGLIDSNKVMVFSKSYCP